MSIKCRNLVPGALAAVGLLFGPSLVSPPAQAGDAAIMVPAEDRDVPEGSQIPDWRLTETEVQVQAYKAKMRAAAAAKKQESQPQAESPKP